MRLTEGKEKFILVYLILVELLCNKTSGYQLYITSYSEQDFYVLLFDLY